jgi:plastocyanin
VTKAVKYVSIDIIILMSIALISIFALYGIVNIASYTSIIPFEARAQNQPTKLISSLAPSSSEPSADTTKNSDTTIEIPINAQNPSSNQFYVPRNGTVVAGSQVTWINKDTVLHTATADDGSFDTGFISPGQKTTIMVNGQGTKGYYCLPHPWMRATLLVSASSS